MGAKGKGVSGGWRQLTLYQGMRIALRLRQVLNKHRLLNGTVHDRTCLAKGRENGKWCSTIFLDMSIVDIYALPLEVPEETACLTRTIDALDGNGGAKATNVCLRGEKKH